MEFGELKNVALREVWDHEANDFTPWLAKNMERLSDAIGVPMELEGTEVEVEQFSADIVARNPSDDSRVLIENQLQGSDHTHLGQILTYLAGVQAQTVVWIAPDFRDSHRSAIRWLNDHTAEPFAFFAVRVRVVQIADSPMVPLFEVLERPSAWDRIVRETVGSDRSEFRREFWAHYLKRHPDDGVPPGYAGSSFWVPIKSAELNLSLYLAKGSVGVWVRGRRSEPADKVRERILAWEGDLRDAIGVEIGDGTSGGSFANSHYKVDTKNRANWTDMADWLHDKIREYRRVLDARPTSSSSHRTTG
ncbi:MAG: hypothetical protein OXJ90_13545 [Spirochaetaceae bacterium]|nr:hypothetical protein [Spirochaetaceae bacterium]